MKELFTALAHLHDQYFTFGQLFVCCTCCALMLCLAVFFELLIPCSNIIHRDVKPSNFLFSFDTGSALLIDFGLAHKVCIVK